MSSVDEVKLPDAPIRVMKKTLSKYAVVVKETEENSEEEYGSIDPTYATERKAKKSLSKFQPTVAEETGEKNDGHDSDEDYGEMKPEEFNKVVKKSLSKHVPNTEIVVKPTVEEVQKMEASDEEYGDDIDTDYIPKRVIKKSLSRYAVQQGDVVVVSSVKPQVDPRVAADSDEEYGADNEGRSRLSVSVHPNPPTPKLKEVASHFANRSKLPKHDIVPTEKTTKTNGRTSPTLENFSLSKNNFFLRNNGGNRNSISSDGSDKPTHSNWRQSNGVSTQNANNKLGQSLPSNRVHSTTSGVSADRSQINLYEFPGETEEVNKLMEQGYSRQQAEGQRLLVLYEQGTLYGGSRVQKARTMDSHDPLKIRGVKVPIHKTKSLDLDDATGIGSPALPINGDTMADKLIAKMLVNETIVQKDENISVPNMTDGILENKTVDTDPKLLIELNTSTPHEEENSVEDGKLVSSTTFEQNEILDAMDYIAENCKPFSSCVSEIDRLPSPVVDVVDTYGSVNTDDELLPNIIRSREFGRCVDSMVISGRNKYYDISENLHIDKGNIDSLACFDDPQIIDDVSISSTEAHVGSIAYPFDSGGLNGDSMVFQSCLLAAPTNTKSFSRSSHSTVPTAIEPQLANMLQLPAPTSSLSSDPLFISLLLRGYSPIQSMEIIKSLPPPEKIRGATEPLQPVQTSMKSTSALQSYVFSTRPISSSTISFSDNDEAHPKLPDGDSSSNMRKILQRIPSSHRMRNDISKSASEPYGTIAPDVLSFQKDQQQLVIDDHQYQLQRQQDQLDQNKLYALQHERISSNAAQILPSDRLPYIPSMLQNEFQRDRSLSKFSPTTLNMCYRSASTTSVHSNRMGSGSFSMSRSMSNSIDEDDYKMRLARLVKEQNQMFGTNMFDSLTNQDEMRLKELLSLGISSDEAVYMIFHEKRGFISAPRYFSPPSTKISNSTSEDAKFDSKQSSGDCGLKKTSKFVDPTVEARTREEQQLGPVAIDWNSNSNGATSPTVGLHSTNHTVDQIKISTSSGGSFGKKAFKKRLGSFGFSNMFTSSSKSTDELDNDIAQLMKLRLKYKEKDVETITSMGFTREQAIQSLIENNNKVNVAVHSLIASGGRA